VTEGEGFGAADTNPTSWRVCKSPTVWPCGVEQAPDAESWGSIITLQYSYPSWSTSAQHPVLAQF